MDSGCIELKQTVVDKLRHNGTLDRIQAELRYAIFLALESNEDNELEISRSELDMRSGYSVIYHFLRQNRFLATAAVFEKEVHQEIISLEELKKDDTMRFCLQLFGDTITFTKSVKENNIPDCRIVSSDPENKREGSGQKVRGWNVSEIKKNGINDIDSNAASSRERNPKSEENVKVERQGMPNSDSNITLESEISSSENGTPESIKKEKLDGKPDDEKGRKCNERSGRSSGPSISEQQQETPKESSTKYQISSYPKKLPPITSTRNDEELASKRLPTIPSLSNASHTGTTFLQRLDTILNSPLSNKDETDEDIVEEIIIDELLQSNNNSDDTNSF